ncbi:hypothetical protein C8J55DRAFT_260746 [Lentinula edodes]|uniref:Hydrophobin n=1 Tax=Lentinula lateritia TaxID=40482 RepID=A0A9W8ZSW7_9AGAR|nr:hypothetical protein C8J55DRAFT_260746 [Lentinula edodes]
MSFINKAFTFASIFLVAVEASVLAQRQTSCATLLESCADSACCDGFTCASLPILGSVCSIALPTGTSTGSTGSTGSSSTGSSSSTGLPGSICAASGEPCVTLAGDSICCTGLTCSTSLLGILGFSDLCIINQIRF